MQPGKQKRLARILNPKDNHAIIVPMDHGMTIGPVRGLENIRQAVSDVIMGGADAVLMHKGLVRHADCAESNAGLIVHLSATTALTPNTNDKALVGTVEEALRLDADCVSVHVNIGDPNERQMLADAGRIAESCERWGMPLLMMLYARGPRIKNAFDAEVVAHCARVGEELGADIVKVPYTGDVQSFAHVTESCDVPVVIAGGERMDSTRQLLEMVQGCIAAHGAGLSIGRNVFQHPDRINLVRALRALVHENADVEHALALMENEQFAQTA